MSENITIQELVHKLYAATQRMGRKNQHRALMLHSMSAIIQLSRRIDAQEERQAEREDKRVELVTL